MKANFVCALLRYQNALYKYPPALLSHSELARCTMIGIFSRGVAVAAEQPLAVTILTIPPCSQHTPAPRDPAAATETVPRLQNLKQQHRIR